MDAVPTPPDLEAALAHERFVRAVAARVLGGDPEVDDVVQETWMRALLAPPRRPGALRAWLATVARNLAIGRRRASATRARHETVGARSARGTTSPSVAEVAAQEDVRRRLVDAILALEEPYRTTLLARYREDRTPTDVATRLGVPVETVHTRLHRGLAMLRARLDRDHGGDRRAWAVALSPWATGALPAGIAATVVATVGGLVMGKAIAIGAATAVIAALGYLAWPRSDDPTHRTPTADPSAPASIADATQTGGALAAKARTQAPARAGVASGTEGTSRTFQGVVVDPDGKPVVGASVAIRGKWGIEAVPSTAASNQAFVDSRTAPLVVGATDASGRFTLVATAEEWQWSVFEIVAEVSAVGWVRAAADITSPSGIRVVLQRGGGVRVSVVLRDGRPAAGATLVWRRGQRARGRAAQYVDEPTPALFSTADASGVADVHLEPGPWRARAFLAGQRPVDSPDLDVVEGATQSIRITLDEGIVVEARVTDSAGAPVAQARVLCGGPMKSLGEASTDAAGRCRIAGIAPPRNDALDQGVYGAPWRQLFYRLVAPSGAIQEGSVEAPPGPAVVPLDLRLAPSVPVRLRVVDEDGAPIAGASVAVSLNGVFLNPIEPREVEAFSAGDGFVALPPFVAGRYRAIVGQTSKTAIVLPRSVEWAVEREPVSLVVELLWADRSVDVAVVGPNGEALDGASVRVGRRDGDYAGAGIVVRGVDGRFRTEHAPRGPLDALVSAPGMAPQRHAIESGVPVAIRMRAGPVVSGVLVQGDGKPIARVMVVLNTPTTGPTGTPGSTAAATTVTGSDGAFRLVLGEADGRLAVPSCNLTDESEGAAQIHASDGDRSVRLVADRGRGPTVAVRLLTADGPYVGEAHLFVKVDGRVAFAMGAEVDAAGVGRFDVPSRMTGPLAGAEVRVPGFVPVAIPTMTIPRAPSAPPIDVRLDRGVAVRLRIVGGDGECVANRWLRVNNCRLQTDASGEVAVWGFVDGERVFGVIQAIGDEEFTSADFRAERAPATIDVVLARRALLNVRLPIPWEECRGRLVVVVLRPDRSVVTEKTIEPEQRTTWTGSARTTLRVAEAGAFRVSASCDTGSWAQTVTLAPGRAFDVDLSK